MSFYIFTITFIYIKLFNRFYKFIFDERRASRDREEKTVETVHTCATSATTKSEREKKEKRERKKIPDQTKSKKLDQREGSERRRTECLDDGARVRARREWKEKEVQLEPERREKKRIITNQ